MVRFCKMFVPMVLSIITVVQSVCAGYDYPKPSVPFELPIQDSGAHLNPQVTNQEHQKTISYSIPYQDFNYLQQHKSKNVINVFDNGAENSPHQNLHTSALQDLASHEPINTKLNANIDGVVSVQSTSEQSHVIREQDSINAQPIFSSVTNPVTISPPVVNLQTRFEVSNSHVHETNLPNVYNNVPTLLNIDNNDQNLVSVNNNLSPVLNLLGNNQPITNVENSYLPPPNEVNIPRQLFNVPNSNHIDAAQYNEVPVNENYDIPHDILPLQQSVQFNIDDDVSNGININNNVPQLLVQNNIQSISQHATQIYQQNDVNLVQNVQNLAQPVITKHIYFHVPPTDIEEAPVVRAPLPAKKIYKIVFIKLPSQESRNNVQLQALLQNQLAPIEDKTLIYVLAKRPEPAQVVLTQPKVSEHEVLFVNYKENKPVSDLDNAYVSNAFENSELALQPGLVNGNK